jgi:hypothetical protein
MPPVRNLEGQAFFSQQSELRFADDVDSLVFDAANRSGSH